MVSIIWLFLLILFILVDGNRTTMIQLFLATNVQYEDEYDAKYKSHHNDHVKYIF